MTKSTTSVNARRMDGSRRTCTVVDYRCDDCLRHCPAGVTSPARSHLPNLPWRRANVCSPAGERPFGGAHEIVLELAYSLGHTRLPGHTTILIERIRIETHFLVVQHHLRRAITKQHLTTCDAALGE